MFYSFKTIPIGLTERCGRITNQALLVGAE